MFNYLQVFIYTYILEKYSNFATEVLIFKVFKQSPNLIGDKSLHEHEK